ncbi:unnamed protein product [Prorocentrum cordatum]|uniref:DNA (cytosine-5-)-methyltransferase n=1 Tax=Prorocentrum cordatum TaxID=2364126 RepID=A0ABN9T9K2_9DINO|nr:unnamed protein product [Polarella glacialis]
MPVLLLLLKGLMPLMEELKDLFDFGKSNGFSQLQGAIRELAKTAVFLMAMTNDGRMISWSKGMRPFGCPAARAAAAPARSTPEFGGELSPPPAEWPAAGAAAPQAAEPGGAEEPAQLTGSAVGWTLARRPRPSLGPERWAPRAPLAYLWLPPVQLRERCRPRGERGRPVGGGHAGAGAGAAALGVGLRLVLALAGEVLPLPPPRRSAAPPAAPAAAARRRAGGAGLNPAAVAAAQAGGGNPQELAAGLAQMARGLGVGFDQQRIAAALHAMQAGAAPAAGAPAQLGLGAQLAGALAAPGPQAAGGAAAGVVAADGPLLGKGLQPHVLAQAALTTGSIIEVPTHDDALAVLKLGAIWAADALGTFATAVFGGASTPVSTLQFEQAWSADGGAPLVHLCSCPREGCQAVAGAHSVYHVDVLRVRSPLQLSEAWARPAALLRAAPAGDAGADPLGEVRSKASLEAKVAQLKQALKRRREGRADLFSAAAKRARGAAEPSITGDGGDAESLFHDAPSGSVTNRVQQAARQRPGALLESGLSEMARFLGEREGASTGGSSARVVAYLNSIFFRTIAHAIDGLLEGKLPEVGDLLIQRLKALELSVRDKDWAVVSQLELMDDQPGIVSLSERQAAAQHAPMQARLAEVRSKGRLAASPDGGRSVLEAESPWPPQGKGGGAPDGRARFAPEAEAAAVDRRSAADGVSGNPVRKVLLRPDGDQRPGNPDVPPWIERLRAPRPKERGGGSKGSKGKGAEGKRSKGAKGKGKALGATAGGDQAALACRHRPQKSPAAADPAVGAEVLPSALGRPAGGGSAFGSRPPCLQVAAKEIEEATPHDVPQVLLKLARPLPTRLGEAARRLTQDGGRPTSRAEGRQRDLAPLPFVALPDAELRGLGATTSQQAKVAKQWTHVLIIGLNHPRANCSADPERCAQHGPPSPAQLRSLRMLARAALLFVTRSPEPVGPTDWARELAKKRVAYDGEEVGTAETPTVEQVLPALPPVGIAASVEAVPLCDPVVRRALLDADSMVLPEGVRPVVPPQAKIWAPNDVWEELVEVLWARGLVGPIDLKDALHVGGKPVLCGASGARKGTERTVKLRDGSRGHVLRLIMNLVPSNVMQRVVGGDMDQLPLSSQWSTITLLSHEIMLLTSSDRQCFFYVFRLPPCWRKPMAFRTPVPGRLVGKPDKVSVRVASTTVAMGWISATGVSQHMHRNVLKELIDRVDAEALRGSVSPLLELARAAYEAHGAPGVAAKDVLRQSETQALGDRIDGDLGRKEPPKGYTSQLISLTLWVLAQRGTCRKHWQIVLGRWVRAFAHRRGGMAAFEHVWRWISGSSRGRVLPLPVVDELLLAMSLAPLYFTDFRLSISPEVTCSDASPFGAGGRCASAALGLDCYWYISSEIDQVATRVARNAFPDLKELWDVRLVTREVFVTIRNGCRWGRKLLLMGGFPCQSLSRLNVDRKGPSDPRSGSVGEIVRILDIVEVEFSEWEVEFLFENVDSADQADIGTVTKLLGRKPYRVCASQVLMGSPRGHARVAVPSGVLKDDLQHAESVRCSLLWNAFHVEVVAWLLGHLAVKWQFLASVPSVDLLRESARPVAVSAFCSSRGFAPEQALVLDVMRSTSTKGSDVRISTGELVSSSGWPRLPIPANLRRWSVALQFSWQQTAHINELDMGLPVGSPLDRDAAESTAGIAHVLWQLGRQDAAVLILVAFHCLLRTGELMSIRAEHVLISASHTGLAALPWTKSRARRGAQELVTVDDPVVGRALAWLRQRQGVGPLPLGAGAQFRLLFERACVQAGLEEVGLKPYSLRRGGATHDMCTRGDLGRTVHRGRWSDRRTAQIYINDGLAALAQQRVPDAAAGDFAARAAALARLLASL